MNTEVWITIGIVIIVVWGVIIYEIRTTPPFPSDYINTDEEAELREVPQNEKSPPKSQTYSDPKVPTYKQFAYSTTDCPCQMRLPVEKHTKDCTWMWENHGMNYQLSELQKRYEELKKFGNDEHIYQELHRIEREIQIIKGKN